MEKGREVFQEGTICLEVGARVQSLRSWRRGVRRALGRSWWVRYSL